MQLDAILEVAIGLVMMWLVISVVTMEIQSWLGQALNTRAKFLQRSLLAMFKNEPALVAQIYSHPAIKELGTFDRKGKYKKPTYIPNEVFARVAMELLVNTSKQSAFIAPEEISLKAMADGVKQVQAMNSDLNELMNHLFPGVDKVNEASVSIEEIQEKLKQYQENVEKWFDNNMEKASIWYKQNALTTAFIIGLGVSLFFNVDTLNVIQKLWREPTIRQALVAQADIYELEEGVANITEVPGYFDSLAMPVGWTSVPHSDPAACTRLVTFSPQGEITYRAGNECRVLVNIPPSYDLMGWFLKLLGLLISGLAARQGAPFWFDLLRKLVSIRGSQQPSKPEEAKG
jgi:hypothetical protein